ncbi:MAG TPA: hypothetical protein VKT70_13510, partial [Stellaceae bacterium]|nr:hypothetical protein [Stellaceae bacterium]
MRRGIGTLAVLMVGLSLPAFAQQKETTTTEMRHEVEAVTMKWMDALNSGNIANAEAMFAANAIAVDPYGVQNG